MGPTQTGIPKSYRDSIVCQKAMPLTCSVYQLTAAFPKEERFGLVSQMRRAAVSIPSNIAEGQARHTSGSFVQFISNAEGSAAQLDTQLTLSMQRGFVTWQQSKESCSLLEEVRKMLNALRRSLC